MSIALINQCWPLQMPPTAKVVLISMADQADDGGRCWPSITTTSQRTCVSPRSVIDGIKWLEKSGALIADRTNGRHTKYQLTPGNFQPSEEQSPRSEKRKTHADAALVPMQMPHQCSSRTGADAASTHADAALVPMQMPHQCSSRTGADAASTHADAALVPMQMPHQPMQMPHTNHHEPPVEPSITTKARAKRSASELPDGFAEFWAQYPKKEAKAVAAASWLEKRLHEDLPLRERAMAALAVQRTRPRWTKDDGTYVPNPGTWLNQERWTDEVGTAQTGAATGHAVGSDAYLLANRDAPWWRDAGFENVWEASNARCWHTNAGKFRDGQRVPDDEGVNA